MKRKKLKMKIIEKGLKQKELAERVGVTSQAITDYIRGVYNPGFDVIKKIADELDSTVDELFFNED